MAGNPRLRRNRIVFLGGVQRSGTNMIMELLDRSPDTKVFHESDTRVFDGTYCHRSEAVLHAHARSILPCIVFKALSESYKIAGLMAQFPCSSALWIYRSYPAVVSSNMLRWPGGTNVLARIVRDRSEGDWRAAGMSDKTHEIVRRLFRPGLNIESCQALFWYYRNQLFFDQGFDRDRRVLLVRYDSVAGDPPAELARIGEFLGIRFPRRAAMHVNPDSRTKLSLEIDPPIAALCDEMTSRLDAALRVGPLRRTIRKESQTT